MEQDKVALKKEQRRSRAKQSRRRNRQNLLITVIIIVFIALVVVWLGYSFMQKQDEATEDTVVTTEVDVNPITDYLSDLNESLE